LLLLPPRPNTTLKTLSVKLLSDMPTLDKPNRKSVTLPEMSVDHTPTSTPTERKSASLTPPDTMDSV